MAIIPNNVMPPPMPIIADKIDVKKAATIKVIDSNRFTNK